MKPDQSDQSTRTWVACPACAALDVVLHHKESAAVCPLCAWASPFVDVLYLGSREPGNCRGIWYPLSPDEAALPEAERQAILSRLLSAIRAGQDASHVGTSYRYP